MGLSSNQTNTPARTEKPEYTITKNYQGDNYVEKKVKNQYDDEGNPLSEYPSEELTLRNLGSRVTAELREEMIKQKLLNVPLANFQNKFSGADESALIPSLSPEIDVNASEAEKWGVKDTILNTLTLGFWKWRSIRNRETASNYICDHISLKVGDAPVINPPWQFNELDDIRSDPIYPHMGRVYLNHIYSNFPILVFQPGREKSNANFLTFFGKGLGRDSHVLNNYIRSGGDSSFLNSLSMMLMSAKNLLIGGIESVLGALTGLKFFDASKYITFKPAFKLYRKIANNLLREYGANLGLISLSGEPKSTLIEFGQATEQTGENPAEDKDTLKELSKNDDAETETWSPVPNAPNADEIKKQFEDSPNVTKNQRKDDNGIFGIKNKSIYEILRDKDIDDNSKESFNSTYKGTFKMLDVIEMIPRTQYIDGIESKSNWLNPKTWINAQYLPFLCQNTITVSETFSNSAEEHPLIAQLNSMAQERAQEKSMGGQAGKVLQAIQGFTEDAMNGGNIGEKISSVIGGLALNFATGFGRDVMANASELGMIMNGGGKLSVPQIWSGSSFSRNYSVDFEFWSPVGDIVSIFENVYIPAILLMVLASPIQTGYNSYASPFAIKVYSKGLFSVDFGMVESLTITRGEEKNDRTKANFPKTIKVSMSIKDLQPTLMMSVGGGAFWKYRRANSSMNEYIATMCNLSIADRQDFLRQWKMFWSQSIDAIRDKFTLDNIGYNFSQSILMKPVMAWNKSAVTIDQVSGNLKSNQRY